MPRERMVMGSKVRQTVVRAHGVKGWKGKGGEGVVKYGKGIQEQ